MGMTSLSIVLTVFVLQLHHASPRRRPAPGWLRCVMVRYVARALCMATHVTDYYACARPGTCHAIALHNRRASKRDVCLVGAFGADINGIQASLPPPYHWRRQLWGTGARALLDFQQFNFFSRNFRAAQKSDSDFVLLPRQTYLPPPRRICNHRYTSVCLLATFRNNFRTDLHEIFREGWQWADEQMFKFWW